MKRLTAFLPIHFCIVLALALGMCACAPGARPQEGPFLLEEPARPEEKKLPAPSVWVEAIFVEAGESAVRDLERALGFKLSPTDGRVILNGEEKEKLLALVEAREGARVIASLAVVTMSGQEAQSEDVEQVIFPTEYDTETVKVGGSEGTTNLIPGEVFMVTPGNWEVRDVGTILSVTPTVSRDGKTITLALMPEITELAEWINYGNERYPILQPIFRTWTKTATITIPDGASFVFKESPRTPLHPKEPRSARSHVNLKEIERSSAYDIETATSRLKRNLTIRPEKGTKIITVRYESNNEKPEEAKREAQMVADMVAEAYIQRREDTHRRNLQSVLKDLRLRQNEYREDLKKSVADLAEMKKKFTLDSQDQPIQYQRREQYMQEKGLVRAQIAKLRAYVGLLSDMTVEERVNATQDNVGVYQMSVRLGEQEAALDALLEEYGHEHPLIKAQKKSIARLKERLHGLVNGVVESKKAELRSLEEQEKQLDATIKALDKELAESHRGLVEYETAKKEVDLNTNILLRMEESRLVEELKRKTEGERAPEKPSPQRKEILRKLGTIIPEVKFQDASLKDVVDFFARECDVNIVIEAVVFQPPSSEMAEEGGITVSLRNVALSEVLKYILRYKNLEYVVEDYAVAIVPVGWRPPERRGPKPDDRTRLLTIISAKIVGGDTIQVPRGSRGQGTKMEESIRTQDMGFVTGRVTSGLTGNPVTGCHVFFYERKSRCFYGEEDPGRMIDYRTAAGFYVSPPLPPGVYTVVCIQGVTDGAWLWGGVEEVEVHGGRTAEESFQVHTSGSRKVPAGLGEPLDRLFSISDNWRLPYSKY